MKRLFSSVCGIALMSAGATAAQLVPADVISRIDAIAAFANGTISYEVDVEVDGDIVLHSIVINDDNLNPIIRQSDGAIVFVSTPQGEFEVDVRGLDSLAFEILEDDRQIGVFTVAQDSYVYELRGTAGVIESNYIAEKVMIEGAGLELGNSPSFQFSMTYDEIASQGISDYTQGSGRSSTMISRMTTENTTSESQGEASSHALSVSEDTTYIAEWSDILLADKIAAFQSGDRSLIQREDRVTVSGTSGSARSATQATTVDGQTLVFDAITGASAFNAELADGALTIQLSGQDLSLKLAGSVLPFSKTTVALTGFDTSISVPVIAEQRVANGEFSLRLDDLSVSDNIWEMFDSGEALIREPAALVLDIGFGLKLERGLFQALSDADNNVPATIEYLDINEVSLSALGVNLAANGAVTFDNSNRQPVPQGVLDAEIDGISSLLASLSQIGVLPPEMMMGARMMMGVMLVPADGPDSFTSRIEVAPDGTVTANGIPLQ